MNRQCRNLFGVIILLFTWQSSRAKGDLYDVPKLHIIENKKYSLADELALQVGYLPADPYVKYFTGGLTYTHFFSEFTGWEIVNGQYAVNFPAGIQKDLLANFSTNCTPTQCATADKFPTLNFLATTNLVFTPIYTKNLLFNSKLVYSQISFVGGGGVASYTSNIKNCIDIGVIIRYFLNDSSSVKFDFRDYVFLSPGTNNNLTLVVAYAFNLGSSDKKKNVELDQ